MRDPEADAQSLFALGGNERLKYLLQLFRFDAGAGVGKYQLHILTIRENFQVSRAATGHSVDGIRDEVGEHLAQFPRSHVHHRIRVVAALYSDVSLVQSPLE